jgi:hypothetical protein
VLGFPAEFMSSLAQRLEREIEEISQDYQKHFAGQSRADRDVSRMDKLIARVSEVISSIQNLPDAVRSQDLNQLLEQSQGALTLYLSEKREIVQAQSAGPVYNEFGGLASRANFVFSKYGRHFAGQSRSTRDLGLLAEMIADLDRIHGEMKTIAKGSKNTTFDTDLELVLSNKKMYEKERAEIEKAQSEGNDEDKANRLAALANVQFAVYRTHFAGASRASRRPMLLSRVVDTLKRIMKDMEGLKARGFAADFHPKNMEIVSTQLGMYEKELDEIRKVRKSTSLDDLMGALGDAANKIFQEYRDGFAGKNRAQVDRQVLADICDKLGEVLRQMDELANAQDSDMNENNRAIVLDQLATFESEYEAVVTAQRKA